MELTLLYLLQSLFEVIRLDYEDNVADRTPTKSFIYKISECVDFDEIDYKYKDTLTELIIKRGNEGVGIDLFWNPSRAESPHIHITLNGEELGGNGIGMDEGFLVSDTNEKFYSRSFDTSVVLVVTSQNKMEVLALNYFLKCLLISFSDSFAHNGFENLKVGSQDITFDDSLSPTRIFARGIKLSYMYTEYVPVFDFDMTSITSKLGIDTISHILDSKIIAKQVINKIIYPKK